MPYAPYKRAIPGLSQDKIVHPWSYTYHESVMSNTRGHIRPFARYKRTILRSPDIKRASQTGPTPDIIGHPWPCNGFNRTILDFKL